MAVVTGCACTLVIIGRYGERAGTCGGGILKDSEAAELDLSGYRLGRGTGEDTPGLPPVHGTTAAVRIEWTERRVGATPFRRESPA